MRSLFTALRALFFAACFTALWVWMALWVRNHDTRFGVALPNSLTMLGMTLILLGTALALLCIFSFVFTGRGTPAPFDPPREFVATGPYRVVRNPMYLGALAVIVGFAFYLRSLSILAFSAAWILAAHVFVVLYEEPHLRRAFGSGYEDYLDRVPRWIPGTRGRVRR